MRIKVLACKVFSREVSLIAAESPHVIDVTFLQQGLHDTPEVLHAELQKAIDLIDDEADIHTQRFTTGDGFAGIVLGYGLCSNAVVGLSSKNHRLVVPRAHDCIALIVGSHQRYQRYFDEHPGTYWFSPGWVDYTLMPGSERTALLRDRYVTEYGEENADFLMETEQQWLSKYSRCTQVCWDELNCSACRAGATSAAAELGWETDRLACDSGWMRRLLNGEWNQQETLVVAPGKRVTRSYDEHIVSEE